MPARLRWCAGSRVRSSSPSRMLPPMGRISPAIVCSSVLLPAPLCPTSACTVPPATVSPISCTTVPPLYPALTWSSRSVMSAHRLRGAEVDLGYGWMGVDLLGCAADQYPPVVQHRHGFGE